MGEKQSTNGDSRHRVTRGLVLLALAVAAGVLLGEVLRATPRATAQVMADEAKSGQFIAVPGQISDDTHGLYLIDRQSGTITMYEWQPTVKKLRLVAARNASYDMKLDEYNTEPSPSEIRQLVRQGQLLGSQTRPAAAE